MSDTVPHSLSAAKQTSVEVHKETSRQLRGSIAEELLASCDRFNEQNKSLIKFHGFYQQEDRDARKRRANEKSAKQHQFMVRCKIPGGRLTAAQYLAVDDLAGRYANGTLRFTTRQGIQLHGVLKGDLQVTIAGINHCLLTTLGACGDVNRNVMACPAPHVDGVHAELQAAASALANHFAPRTEAYHEIWLDGEAVTDASREGEAPAEPNEAGGSAGASPSQRQDPHPILEEEPLYGKVYLPRKFKMGLALPEDNCIDVYAQDLGFVAVVEYGTIVGYNVLVGGGMGRTHGNEHTFPHLAQPICYVSAAQVIPTAEAVVKLFRDHGNRADRKRARIKYLVHDWGVPMFRKALTRYAGKPLEDPRPLEVRGYDPHLGWHPQGDGRWYYGISVANGRVKDAGACRLRSALRAIIERFQPDLRLTPLQDVLLCNLEAPALSEIERILAEHGVRRPEQLSLVQQFSMACPALPTCGLALSEAERALPNIIDELEDELRRLGLEHEKIGVRMTGCPNGCARPYQSDIGIVGRSGDKYSVFVGGNLAGTRLNFLLQDLVPRGEIVALLAPLLEHFRSTRLAGESFGNYCHRMGLDALIALGSHAATRPIRSHAPEPTSPALRAG